MFKSESRERKENYSRPSEISTSCPGGAENSQWESKTRNPDCKPQLEVGKRRQGAGREDDTQAHIPEGTLSFLKGGACAGAEDGDEHLAVGLLPIQSMNLVSLDTQERK